MGTRFWQCATALARWTDPHSQPESALISQCPYFYFLFYFFGRNVMHAYMKYSGGFNIVCVLFLKVKSIGHRKEGMVCS